MNFHRNDGQLIIFLTAEETQQFDNGEVLSDLYTHKTNRHAIVLQQFNEGALGRPMHPALKQARLDFLRNTKATYRGFFISPLHGNHVRYSAERREIALCKTIILSPTTLNNILHDIDLYYQQMEEVVDAYPRCTWELQHDGQASFRDHNIHRSPESVTSYSVDGKNEQYDSLDAALQAIAAEPKS